MTSSFIGVIGAASLVVSADAGLAGFVAFSRNVGANTVIDVFAAVTNASDKFLNVYDTQSNGSFVQKAGLSSKTWKPDAANFTSTRAVADDSFMTAGTYSGGSYGGEYYASGNSNADPNFTGTSWNGTPASAAATAIPNLAGWYTGDPTSVDNGSELMSTWATSVGATRKDSNLVSASGGYAAPASSSGATRGMWVAHLVIAGTNKVLGDGTGGTISFSAFASIKDGVTGATTQAKYSFADPIPAPGAIALLGVAGLLTRRRR
jgi:MYXO-CTERM domain-containing protein